jgi:hypothetical protein
VAGASRFGGLDRKVIAAAKSAWERRRDNRPDRDGTLKDPRIYGVQVEWGVTKSAEKAFRGWSKETSADSDWTFYTAGRTTWLPTGSIVVGVDLNAESYSDGVGETFDSVPSPRIFGRVDKRDFMLPVKAAASAQVAGKRLRLTSKLRKEIWNYMKKRNSARKIGSYEAVPLGPVLSALDE